MNTASIYHKKEETVVDAQAEDILHLQWLHASWTKTFLDGLEKQMAELLLRATNLSYTECDVSVLLRERNVIERIIVYARSGHYPSH